MASEICTIFLKARIAWIAIMNVSLTLLGVTLRHNMPKHKVHQHAIDTNTFLNKSWNIQFIVQSVFFDAVSL